MISLTHIGKFELPMPAFVRNALEGLWIRYYFKFVLPKITSTEVDGIKLDLRQLSPKIRNRILRGYEEAEKQLCREFLRKNDSVLELGGGIGFIGLFCQKRLGIKRYTTVEANPQTIQLLKKNYSLNGVEPTVLNYAIGDRDGTVKFDISGDFWEHGLGSSSNTIDVPSTTFNKLLSIIGYIPNTLIIDVEGAEKFINFREIPEEIRKIIIEIHPVIVGQCGIQNIIGSLCSLGFTIAGEEGCTLAFTRSD